MEACNLVSMEFDLVKVTVLVTAGVACGKYLKLCISKSLIKIVDEILAFFWLKKIYNLDFFGINYSKYSTIILLIIRLPWN